MENSQTITRVHKGTTYFANSESQMIETIKKSEYNRSIFYRTSVYTYSMYARRIEDNKIEKVSFYNNGEQVVTVVYNSEDEFWKSL